MTWKATIVHGNADIVSRGGHRNRVTARAWARENENRRHATDLRASAFAPGPIASGPGFDRWGTEHHYVLVEIEPEPEENP